MKVHHGRVYATSNIVGKLLLLMAARSDARIITCLRCHLPKNPTKMEIAENATVCWDCELKASKRREFLGYGIAALAAFTAIVATVRNSDCEVGGGLPGCSYLLSALVGIFVFFGIYAIVQDS
jgi:hypothetical protein